MKRVFKNALTDGILTDITVENGKIISMDKTASDGEELGGMKVLPGLIDIHTHGCLGDDAMDSGFEKITAFHAKNGVTSFLPTTMTASAEALKKITSADISKTNGANILGFHLEGPYISHKYKGAQNGRYIQAPNPKDFKELKNVKMVTLAPELEGSMEFIKSCGCIVSLGHTDADYETALKAIDAGALCLTHTFNAMPPLHHRNPSVIGAASDKNIYAQVICDGLHIHPSAIRILYKIFGAERMILISDSMRAAGLGDGCYDLGGQQVFVKNGEARLADGTLAGSVTTLLGCVKCAVKFGIPEKDAVRMASQTPSELLGIKKGKLAPGYDADFIVTDSELNVIKTVIGGKSFDFSASNRGL